MIPTRERIEAAVAFALGWLSTPSSLVGITAILTGFAGKYISPEAILGLSWTVVIVAGAILVALPQKPK